MQIKLANKLVALFLALSIIPLLIVGGIAYERTAQTLRALQYEKLSSLAEERASKIEELFAERGHDAELLAQFPVIAQILSDFETAFSSGGLNSAAYQQAEQKHGQFIENYASKLGLADLILITSGGDIVSTSAKESDLGTNLSTGPYKDSELARVFKSASEGTASHSVTIQVYQPSGKPAIFTAAPVIRAGEITGVLAFQIPIEKIYSFARDYIGLGETGETVLATQQGEHVLMVAPTRHDPKAALQRNVLMGSENAKPIQEAVCGNSDTGEFTDYRGVKVLAAWRYLPMMNIGLVLKIDQHEAFAPIHRLARWFSTMGIITFLVVLSASLAISRSISRPIVDITRATTRMASGDLAVRTTIHTGDEIELLSTAFNNMADRLKEAYEETQDQDWLKTGITGLDETMRGARGLPALCEDVTTYIARYLDVQVGTLSLTTPDHSRLKLAGSYAYKGRPGAATEFRFGEGLIGQAAQEKKRILMTHVPENSFTITSALGEILPDSILCMPLLYEHEVNGVIELGSMKAFTDLQLEFLDRTAEGIAIAINSAHSRERMKTLLEESQAQAEEMQAQQEELKVANEELQLKGQELETQQEELRITNEELEKKNLELQHQGDLDSESRER